jgi:surface polysaccharide O-acyltransferase-like enzyme
VPFWVKTAVPIFFMISGALLLGKEEPISTIWKKRIWRFLQVIFVFSLINYVWFYHNLPLSIPGHIAKFFTLLYTSDLATAYYFLYIYISFLLMLPIWRKLVKVLDEKLYLYLIGLNLFFVGVMPMVSFLIFKGSAEMNYFLNPLLAVSEPTFYFLMGYWIENVLPQSWLTKRNLVKLGIAALLGTAAAGAMTWYHGIAAGGMTEAISERFYDSFLFLNTAFVFCTCRWWFSTHHVSEKTGKALVFFGSMSFGVMLFEEITRNLTHVIYTHILLKYMYRIPFIDAVIWISMAYALGVVITWGLKKIPYFARLI